METSDVVIVGGGAVGCATAYFLAKDGVKVTVLEKDTVAGAASGYAMGLLSPLSGAGIPGPLEELSLVGFLMHRDLVGELKEATGLEYHAHPKDSIYLAFSDEEAEALGAIEDYSSKVDGVSCRWLNGAEIRTFEPRVSEAVPRGLLVEGTWLLEADEYTRALAKGAEGYGAIFRENEVTGLKRSGGNLRVQTEGGVIEAEKVVLAMGPWTGAVQEWFDLPVPVSPLKGQILRMEIPGPPMRCSLHYNSNYAGSKPDGLVWIGTTEERVGFDDQPTEEAKVKIIKEVAIFFPPVTEGRLVRQTACLRPVSSDGLPIIGQVPGWDGVYLSTGAGRKGIILSPSMGKVTADLVAKGQSEISVDIFSPGRFMPIAGR
ncbi:MAG: FAD-dependent oxidoreductase [Dehalococcoidia bacterium]|nr:FAD-dependent oxidoreductase [Chloroflexota bacterium]MCZ6866282.1 FAD-dependent oxidoreductase [Chloroflexota bacterium]